MTNYLFLTLLAISTFTSAEQNKTMEGYWLTSQSIVQVKNCDKNLCAIMPEVARNMSESLRIFVEGSWGPN